MILGNVSAPKSSSSGKPNNNRFRILGCRNILDFCVCQPLCHAPSGPRSEKSCHKTMSASNSISCYLRPTWYGAAHLSHIEHEHVIISGLGSRCSSPIWDPSGDDGGIVSTNLLDELFLGSTNCLLVCSKFLLNRGSMRQLVIRGC